MEPPAVGSVWLGTDFAVRLVHRPVGVKVIYSRTGMDGTHHVPLSDWTTIAGTCIYTPPQEPKAGETWRHRESGTKVVVLAVAGGGIMVKPCDYPLWAKPLAEFVPQWERC